MQRAIGKRAEPWNTGAVLTIGFATTTAMWTAGYLLRLPGVELPPPVVFFVMLIIFFSGSAFLGSRTTGVLPAILHGVLVILLNMLILGGLLSEANGSAPAPPAYLLVPGSFVFGAVLSLLGGVLGKSAFKAKAQDVNWQHNFSIVCALSTFILMVIGALVTTHQAGLAVPDWPTSFGYNMFLYPLSRMTGGVYYEHSHRLFGALIGLCVLALAIYLQISGAGRLVKLLAWLAFITVVVQGVLGGARVTGTISLASPTVPSPSPQLAVVHGVLAQILFGLIVLIAVTTSRAFLAEEAPFKPERIDKLLTQLLLLFILLQLILGALLRHMDGSILVHTVVAVVILVLALKTGQRVIHAFKDVFAITRVGRVIIFLVVLQFLLGLTSWLLNWYINYFSVYLTAYLNAEMFFRTAHQAVGALLLGSTVILFAFMQMKPANQ